MSEQSYAGRPLTSVVAAPVTEGHTAAWHKWINWAAGALGLLLILPLVLPPFEPLNVISNFWPYLAIPLLLFSLLSVRRRPALGAFCGFASAVVLYVCVRSLNPIDFPSPFSSNTTAEPGSGDELKVISFNVLTDNRSNADKVRDFLISQNADFIFLQEARGFVEATGGIEAAVRRLGPHYPYQSGCEPGGKCSLLLLSKHPLRSVRRPDVSPGYHRFVIAQADVRGRDITLVGIHLSKPLENGLQEQQISLIGDIVKGLPRPLILAGDMNAAPWSTTLRRLLKQADLRYSYGYNPNWPVWAPGVGLPIDHVVTDGMRVVDVQAWPQSIGSNHLPVIAEIVLP